WVLFVRKVVEQFGVAAREAYTKMGFQSLRTAGLATGIAFTTIGGMMKGETPGTANLKRWADALNEPVAKWVSLASGEPYDGTDAVAPAPVDTPPIQFTHPDPPQEVLDAIACAPSRDEKVQVAWDYLRRPELKLRFGAYKGDSTGRRVAIIRHYERTTGVSLLPPEVI
ncbi:MAG: hypothetical protein WCL39_14665, partial [Armatimonadota bacterium]